MTVGAAKRWWVIGGVTVAVTGLVVVAVIVVGGGRAADGGPKLLPTPSLGANTEPARAESCQVETLDWPLQNSPAGSPIARPDASSVERPV